jgi:hypothetical protein
MLGKETDYYVNRGEILVCQPIRSKRVVPPRMQPKTQLDSNQMIGQVIIVPAQKKEQLF